MRREALVVLFGILVTAGVLVGVGYTLSQRNAIANANETIDLAEGIAQEERWEDVIEALTPLANGAPLPEQSERVWMLLAQAHGNLGHENQASAQWQRLADEGQDLQRRGLALLELAMGIIRSGEDLEDAQAHLDRFREIGVAGLNDRLLFVQANLHQAQGDEAAAREALAEARNRYPESELTGEIEDLLTDMNLASLFSGAPDENDTIYVIEAGDNLWDLGRRFGVSHDLIARVNRITPSNLSLGRRIKIPVNEFRIEVYKDEYFLYVFDGDTFFARYPCRVGREDYMTPEQTFTIEARTVDPTWNDPVSRRTIPAGDPANELGTRWLGFRENTSLGIHGTIHPETIGTRASSGCIGLLTEDIEELFDLIPRGTEVRIFGSRAQAEREREASRD